MPFLGHTKLPEAIPSHANAKAKLLGKFNNWGISICWCLKTKITEMEWASHKRTHTTGMDFSRESVLY